MKMTTLQTLSSITVGNLIATILTSYQIGFWKSGFSIGMTLMGLIAVFLTYMDAKGKRND